MLSDVRPERIYLRRREAHRTPLPSAETGMVPHDLSRGDVFFETRSLEYNLTKL